MRHFSAMVLVVGLVTLYGCFSEADVGWAKLPRPIREIKVMVIDTGIARHSKLEGRVAYDDSKDYQDNHGHGTHVAGIVLFGNHMMDDPLCREVTVYACRYYDPKSSINNNLKASIACVQRAIDEGFDYINYSGGGLDLSFKELEAYRTFTNRGGVAVVSAGNEKSNLEKDKYFPALYALGFTFQRKDEKTRKMVDVFVKPFKNMYAVENMNEENKRAPSSNWHPLAHKAVGTNVYSTLPQERFGYMTGTSQAAPALLHTLLKQRCKEFEVGFQTASN